MQFMSHVFFLFHSSIIHPSVTREQKAIVCSKIRSKKNTSANLSLSLSLFPSFYLAHPFMKFTFHNTSHFGIQLQILANKFGQENWFKWLHFRPTWFPLVTLYSEKQLIQLLIYFTWQFLGSLPFFLHYYSIELCNRHPLC